MLLLAGCHPVQPIYFGETGDLSHYVGRATDIETSDVHVPSLPETEYAEAPLTLSNADFDNVFEMTLGEAIKHALANSKVFRSLGGRVDVASDQLLRNPDFARTIYGPAIQETSAGLGTGFAIGPEAALSAFDAEFTSSVFWEKNDRPNNVIGDGQIVTPQFLQQDLGNFQAQLSKASATGGVFFFRNTTSYDQNNTRTDFRPIPSEWRTNFEAEWRQPLMQGAGVQYNEIAGPFAPFSNIGSRNFDGVLIARINTDVSLTEFETAVRDLVSEVENTYWELYFAYRNLEARKVGLDSSLRTWQTVNALAESQAEGGGIDREALAREQYWTFVGQVQQAKSDVFSVQNRLRYIIGLTASDGRLIRPADDPVTAKLAFEWREILHEGLSRSVELRRQKWLIKQHELELLAAKNHLLPRLDAVGRYRWNGLGDDLIDTRDDGEGRFDNAFGNLLDGDFQDWQLGLQLSMRLGFRAELAAVRHQQLLLARDKAVLKEQEFELSHLLDESIRELDLQAKLVQTNLNRRVAAQTQVDAFLVKVEIGIGRSTQQLNLLLDAQQRLADAETAYYRSIVDYNRAITQLHFLKGSLLEYNGVFLTEGPWPAKAYFDAKRLARQRGASKFINYGFTRPQAFSKGAFPQATPGHVGPAIESPAPLPTQHPSLPQPELLPTPQPEPPAAAADQPRTSEWQSTFRGHRSVAAAGGGLPPRRSVLKQASAEQPVSADDVDVTSGPKRTLEFRR